MHLYSACVCVKINNEEFNFLMLSSLKIRIILFLNRRGAYIAWVTCLVLYNVIRFWRASTVYYYGHLRLWG